MKRNLSDMIVEFLEKRLEKGRDNTSIRTIMEKFFPNIRYNATYIKLIKKQFKQVIRKLLRKGILGCATTKSWFSGTYWKYCPKRKREVEYQIVYENPEHIIKYCAPGDLPQNKVYGINLAVRGKPSLIWQAVAKKNNRGAFVMVGILKEQLILAMKEGIVDSYQIGTDQIKTLNY